MKIILSAALVFSIFTWSGHTAEEPEVENQADTSSSPRVEEQNKWTIEEEGCLKIHASTPEFIRLITLDVVSNSSYYVKIFLYKPFLNTEIHSPLNKLKQLGNFGCGQYLGDSFISTKTDRIGEFLSFFYDSKVIDDCVVDNIKFNLLKAGIAFQDFRRGGKSLLEWLNGQLDMVNEPTVDDFKTIAYTYLDKTIGPVQKQLCIWDMIESLREQSPVDKNLMIEFLKQITDESLPFYNKAVLELAELCATDDSDTPSIERSEKKIEHLLPIAEDPEARSSLNLLINMYINNDRLNTGSNAPQLQDMDISVQSVLALLRFARMQNAMLAEKDQEIAKLQKRLQEKD